MTGRALSRRRALGAAGGVLAGGGLLAAAGPVVSPETSAGDDAALIALCGRIADIENFIDQYHAHAPGPRTIEAEDARNEAMEPLWAEHARLVDDANAIRATTLAGVRTRVAMLRRWAPNFLRGLSDAERGMLVAVFEEFLGGEMR